MANNPFKRIIREEHVTRREFAYTKDDVSLKFTLRVDNPKELRIFKELMQKAIEDIDEELQKHGE